MSRTKVPYTPASGEASPSLDYCAYPQCKRPTHEGFLCNIHLDEMVREDATLKRALTSAPHTNARLLPEDSFSTIRPTMRKSALGLSDPRPNPVPPKQASPAAPNGKLRTFTPSAPSAPSAQTAPHRPSIYSPPESPSSNEEPSRKKARLSEQAGTRKAHKGTQPTPAFTAAQYSRILKEKSDLREARGGSKGRTVSPAVSDFSLRPSNGLREDAGRSFGSTSSLDHAGLNGTVNRSATPDGPTSISSSVPPKPPEQPVGSREVNSGMNAWFRERSKKKTDSESPGAVPSLARKPPPVSIPLRGNASPERGGPRTASPLVTGPAAPGQQNGVLRDSNLSDVLPLPSKPKARKQARPSTSTSATSSSMDSPKKKGRRPRVGPQTAESNLDLLVYSQEGASRPPAGVRVSKRPCTASAETAQRAAGPETAPETAPGPPRPDRRFVGHIDPRAHWGVEHSKAWHEAKQQEIRGRGGRKANFGRAAERMREVRVQRPAAGREDGLPERMRSNAAWVRGLEWFDEMGKKRWKADKEATKREAIKDKKSKKDNRKGIN